MTTSTVRYALISMIVTLGLVVGTAATGTAATRPASQAAVTFGAPLSASSTASAAHACQSGSSVCVSSEPRASLAWSSAGSTAGCRFRLVIDWGDGTKLQTVNLAGKKAATSWPVGHNYPGSVAARKPYQIRATATVVKDTSKLGCSIQSAATTFTLNCTAQQLSGPAWEARFPGGNRAVEDLNDEFQPKVEAFVAAMQKAGITVSPQSTMRSPQRSYLMHYSYKIAKGQISPEAAGAYLPVAKEAGPKICWTHRTATGKVDRKASAAAAASLLRSLGVDTTLATPPALRSRHNTGDAIDMRIGWTAGSVKIKTAVGKTVSIASTPKDGTNAKLIAVGATYGVIHFSPVLTDRNHWSSDGR